MLVAWFFVCSQHRNLYHLLYRPSASSIRTMHSDEEGEDQTITNPVVMEKYKAAAKIVNGKQVGGVAKC